MATDHNALIAKAAKAALGPLGCTRKGTSRTWFDDHGWWIGVVEFQPSRWAKGTYLNVGSCWLWSENDFLSFDDGYRVQPFQEFKDEVQFENVVQILAEKAKDEVLKLRERFHSIESTAAHLEKKGASDRDIWTQFHAGISAGLTGSANDAKTHFRQALDADNRDIDWVLRLKSRCNELLGLVENTASFRSHVGQLVASKRAALKLPISSEVCFGL